MSESALSICKTLSWVLAILLIGVTALYSWHNKNQREILAGRDARISESAQLLENAKQELDRLQKTSKTLRAQSQELMGKLKAAETGRQAVRDDMKAAEAQHAQTIDEEREKARAAYAELESRYKAADKKIAALKKDIEQREKVANDAAAAREAKLMETRRSHEAKVSALQATHKSKTQELERRMSEKIDFYRTALEGSDPERAAQLAAFQQQAKDSQNTAEEARQALQATQEKAEGLEGQLAAANRVIAERDKALSKAGQELEAAQEAAAKLEHAFQRSKSAHKKTKTEAAAELQAAKATHASRIAKATDKIADLAARLQDETAALEALRQKHSAVVAELRGSLSNTEQALADVEAKLSRNQATATEAQQDCEQKTAEAQSKIDDLDLSLEQLRRKAAGDLAACRGEGEKSVAYVRGLFTEFSELGARQTTQGMLMSLADDELRFRISKADLPKDKLPSLDRIAELLIRYPKLTARIEGHTDSKGRDETNLELSQKRADAVKEALVERGVDQKRLTAQGIGEARPIADNATWGGRRKNRRVEIYVIEN